MRAQAKFRDRYARIEGQDRSDQADGRDELAQNKGWDGPGWIKQVDPDWNSAKYA